MANSWRGRSACVGLAALLAVTGCSSGWAHPTNTDNPSASQRPTSSGPLAGQWKPVFTSAACFPPASEPTRLTQSGLVLRAVDGHDVTLKSVTVGSGTKVSLIESKVVPAGDGDVLGDSANYPPSLTQTQVKHFQLDQARALEGYVLDAAHPKVVLMVGLDFTEPPTSRLDFLDVAYTADGKEFHLYTPEQVQILKAGTDPCAVIGRPS